MSVGTVISGAGHTALMALLILGWGFGAEPLDFEITEVSVITGAEFDALTAQPEPVETPVEPVLPQPVVEEVAPEVPLEETPPPPEPTPPPEPVAEPEPEAPPVVEETEALPPPPPEPVTDPVPTLVVPEPPAGAPELTASPRPQPRPAPRVAPEAALPPPPEAEIAPEVQEAAVPDQPAPEVVEEDAQEETAPEAAATEIVTEAEDPAGGAPTTSLRPLSRPSRPAPQVAGETESDTDTDTASNTETDTETDPVADALTEALETATAEPAAPSGPPLSGSEREGFRIAVQNCWNVDVGSTASGVTVVVGFNLTPQGRVEGDVRLISAEDGDSAAQNAAFQAARRAVLRCQSDGYPLPPEKYEQWREVELTFDPSSMRLR